MQLNGNSAAPAKLMLKILKRREMARGTRGTKIWMRNLAKA